MRVVDFLDRRLVPLCVTGLAGAVAGWVLALAVVLAGCAADDDGISPRDCADRDNAEVCAP